MKFTVAAIALLASASAAAALDLPVAGLSLNTDAVLEHKVDAATTQLDLNPELEYMRGAATLTAGMSLNVWDDIGGVTLADEFDTLPTITFGATYLLMPNLELEAATAYDFEAKAREEITLTATFSF